MSARGRSDSTCAIIRTTRGMDPSISSSRVQISGTSVKPSMRAAYAGNSETRSVVAVKMIEMKSSSTQPLASITWVTISATRSSMWSRSSTSSCVAPRTALTATLRPDRFRVPPRTGSEAGRVEEAAELVAGELAEGTAPHPDQLDRSDGGAGQLPDRVSDVVEQAAHDPVASLVD